MMTRAFVTFIKNFATTLAPFPNAISKQPSMNAIQGKKNIENKIA